ncbi:hypothetical protein LINPERHAP1_LOCUS17719 [Linum perenne]
MTHPQNHPVDDSTRKLWKWLWHLDLPPKIKFFMWRICRNALPTKVGLLSKRCGFSSTCLSCNADDETMEHMLFHCHVSRAIWEQDMPLLHLPTADQHAKSWLSSIATSVSQVTATQIGFTLWYIWKMRNELIFQDISPSVSDISVRKSCELQQWTSNAAIRGTISGLSTSNATSVHLINSLPPTSYSYKVVCDGAFKASIQKGAFGIIIYNAMGDVVNGKAGSMLCAAPICAEAYAVLHAIQMVLDISDPTIIYSDSSVLVDSIAGDHDKWPWSISGILASITRLLYWNQQIQVCKVQRSAVQSAHQVAVQTRDNLLPLDWLSSL